MARVHYHHRNLDVACDLNRTDLAARGAEWRDPRGNDGLGAERAPGGGRLWLRPTAWSAAADLARREAGCCGFLDFDVVQENGRLYLDVRAAVADGAPVAEQLVGLGPAAG